MPAETMVTLDRIVEGGDNIGILQVPPRDIRSPSFFGRWLSFRDSYCICLILAAESYFRLGGDFYYGHHAIVRSEAFTKYCNLPILQATRQIKPGKPVCHDVLESLLLEGAGYTVYLLPHLVVFDLQLHSIIHWAIRGNRWASGTYDWFAVWRYKIFLSMANYLYFIGCYLLWVF